MLALRPSNTETSFGVLSGYWQVLLTEALSTGDSPGLLWEEEGCFVQSGAGVSKVRCTYPRGCGRLSMRSWKENNSPSI